MIEGESIEHDYMETNVSVLEAGSTHPTGMLSCLFMQISGGHSNY